MTKYKKIIIIAIIIIFIIALLTIIGIKKLNENETFFKTKFITSTEKEYEIEIPLHSYYCGAEGNIIYRFKSLKSKEKLQKEIDQILEKYEKMVDEYGNTYYYDREQDLKIFEYTATHDGFFSDILIGI